MYVRVHASTRLFVCVCIMAGCERVHILVCVFVFVFVCVRVCEGERACESVVLV